MRSIFIAVLISAALAACSHQPPPKEGLAKPIGQYSDAEAKALLAKDCTPYQKTGDEAHQPLTDQACSLLEGKIESDSWAAEANVKTAPVGQPSLQ